MGKLGKDFKSLIAGEDGSDAIPEDFKTEVANALKKGIISKPEGALLIATKMNTDKKASAMAESQENDVKKIKQDGTLADLNKYIQVVANQAALPVPPVVKPGDFAYITEGNILAVYTTPQNEFTPRWIQINPDTNNNNDTAVTGLTFTCDKW